MKNLLSVILILCATQLTAQYEIGHASFSFLDPTRNNYDVYGEVYYPATTAGDNVPVAAGEFPVIVFGHGFMVAWSEYDVWWNELVPCGYIMVFPRTQGSLSPTHSEFGIDLSFLVNTYLAEGDDPTSDFYQHINGKSAIMGHSMGGGCTYLAAEQNTNVNTIITLAAAETTTSAIDAAANITIPSLTIAGSEDCVVPTADHQTPIYNGLASVYKAYLEIDGASHCNFGKNSAGSSCSFGELFSCPFAPFMPKAEQHTQMFAASKPWLNYYLKEDCQGWPDFQAYAMSNNNELHTFLESGTETGCPTCINILDINDPSIISGLYEAGQIINSAGQITGTDVDFIAGDTINLNPGFCVPLNTDFDAMIQVVCP